jgi:signal transduction histidine kinase
MKTSEAWGSMEPAPTASEGAPQPLRPVPSIRSLVRAWSLVVGLFAIAAATALAITTRLQRQATDVVLRDMATVATADRIERDLFLHARLSHLSMVTASPALAQARSGEEHEIRELLARARTEVETPDEIRALDDAEEQLDAILADPLVAHTPGLTVDQRVLRSEAAVQRADEAINTLRRMNQAEADAADAEARRIHDLSNAAGVAIAVFSMTALALLILGLDRLVLRPLEDIRAAIALPRGDGAPRPHHAPPEIAEIARALEDARAALTKQDEERAAFLGGVAHDLRNPLGAIKMAVQSARADAPEDRRLSIAERQIERLARMIGDLLDAARIEAGHLELDLRPVDLRSVASEVVELYRETTRHHTLELEAPSGPVMVVGDALRLEQVVANLVTNAIKYSPEGGAVRVRVTQPARDAVVAVTDSGVGIAASEIPLLFSPFRRLASGREVAPGAGLGLSVVQRIVEAHGGAIEVVSAPRAGSTFTVRLPRAVT